ncbi:MAG: hypothetical protein K6A43_01595 [Treponema sp.]|nr:hypothetical protein [Treponema sp.]
MHTPHKMTNKIIFSTAAVFLIFSGIQPVSVFAKPFNLGSKITNSTNNANEKEPNYYESPITFFKDRWKKDYNFALNTANKIYTELEQQEFPYSLEAAAIVFPELIRYSVFQNELETLMNKFLAYASEDSSGFSIGLFQMKPQFAAEVENLIANDSELKNKYSSIDFGGENSTLNSRHDRILRLNDFFYQTEYLKAFIEYEVNVLSLENEDIQTRINYLSAAYNYAICTKRDFLEEAFNWQTFPSGKPGLYFNYQKICLQAADEFSANKITAKELSTFQAQ